MAYPTGKCAFGDRYRIGDGLINRRMAAAYDQATPDVVINL
jgi:hypothetical protein